MKFKRLLFCLVAALLGFGCSLSIPTSSPVPPSPTATSTNRPTVTTSITLQPTLTRTPTLTFTFTPSIVPSETATLTLTPTSTPFKSFTATVIANGVHLRTNPGYLFDVIMNMNQGDTFEVLGKCPGGEWIYGQTQGKKKGWVFTQLLQSGQDLQAIPVIEPTNVQLVKGRVVDSGGNPIYGIQFAITQGSGQNAPRNDAMTDSKGDFYAYMPLSASGNWLVSYVACKEGSCGTIDPPSLTITLPQSQPLLFHWK